MTLRIFQPRLSYKKDGMRAELSFEYEGRAIEEHAAVRGIYHAESRRFILRDEAAEQAAAATLLALGLRFAKADWSEDAGWRIAANRIPRVVRELVEAGWQVFAEGMSFRQPGQFSVSVSSGVDWFELHGTAAFGETTAQLPQLLAALRRGDNMVGWTMAPTVCCRRSGCGASASWPRWAGARRSYSLSAEPGGLLDALLATSRSALAMRPSTVCARAGTLSGDRRRPRSPQGSVGVLRDYQREGPGLDAVSAAVLLWRMPGGRHGRGQDSAGAGAAGNPPGARATGQSMLLRWWWFPNR